MDRVLPGFGRVAVGGREDLVRHVPRRGEEGGRDARPTATYPGRSSERAISPATARVAGKDPSHPVEQAARLAGRAAERPDPFGQSAICISSGTRARTRSRRPGGRCSDSFEVDVSDISRSSHTEITRRNVAELLDGIADRGRRCKRIGPRPAPHPVQLGGRGEIIPVNPLARMKRPTVEKVVAGVDLTMRSGLFWEGCNRLEWAVRPHAQALFLTAQRRTEVAGMRALVRINLKKRQWTIPRERRRMTANTRVHLSVLAVEIIEALPRSRIPRQVGEGRGSTRIWCSPRLASGMSPATARRRTGSTGMPWRCGRVRRLRQARTRARLG